MSWITKTIFNKNFWLGIPSYKKETSKLSVTIVIPAWNEEKFIRATIESCLAQSFYADIIVVNDSSTDKTADIVKEYSSIRLITTDKNQGSKSRALNYAIPFVNTDIFVCVDADTVLDEDALDKLMMSFNNQDVMISSGFVTSKEGKSFWETGRSGEYLIGQTLFKSAQTNADAVLVASGCFFGIRTHFLKRKMFNERTMAEDMDLTWMAIEEGHSVIFTQDAFCTVSDPYDKSTYEKQVSRWYRGFFQNVKVRNFNLFSKNIKLGIVAYSYMFFSFMSMPLFIISTVYLLSHFFAYTIFLTIVGFFSLCLFTMAHGLWYKENVKRYPLFLFNSFLLSFFSYYIYVKSMMQELVLNDKLKVWEKGH